MNKISKEEFYDLDPMEIDEKYGHCLTNEDRDSIRKLFRDENIDDQVFIEKFVDMAYQRAQENDLVS